MKKLFSVIVLSALCISACNNSNDSSGSESVIAKDSALQNNASQNNVSPTSDASVQMPPADNSKKLTAAPSGPATSAPVSNPNAGLTGMNPAHGQPGHRCDIAVGAPLNSPPGNNAPAPVVSPAPPSGNTNAISMPPTHDININAQPAATAPGMNPPHGQPGHDCAIAVGAPLPK